MTNPMTADEALAVLERMRVQADYGRCTDGDITAKVAIRQIDEDRAALNAVAGMMAALKTRDLCACSLQRLCGMTSLLRRLFRSNEIIRAIDAARLDSALAVACARRGWSDSAARLRQRRDLHMYLARELSR
jgi:hypothetical protein